MISEGKIRLYWLETGWKFEMKTIRHKPVFKEEQKAKKWAERMDWWKYKQGSPMSHWQHVIINPLGTTAKRNNFLEMLGCFYKGSEPCLICLWHAQSGNRRPQVGFSCSPARAWDWGFTAGSPKCCITKDVLAPDSRHLWLLFLLHLAALSGALVQVFPQLSCELPREMSALRK